MNVGNKTLTIIDIQSMSTEQITNLYKQGYRIEGAQEQGCSDCGQPNEKSMSEYPSIQSLAVTCTPGTKYPGQTLTLKGTGTGGTPPYLIVFTYGAVEIGRFTGVPAGTEKTATTTIVAADEGNKSANVTITDSCPGGFKSCTETCNVLVVVCPAPTCSFIVT